MDIKKKINKFPDSPGVYLMKSSSGKVVYIGKAKSLRKRVKSYFRPPSSFKNESLMEKVRDIDYIECTTPEQALILEAALIKEQNPKYNIALRDDKSYPYVEITQEPFPRIHMCRPKAKNKGVLFGPYPRGKVLKSALNMLRRIFPYRSCRVMPRKVCLYYHLNLCPGCCSGKVSEAEYTENIKSICMVFRGERRQLLNKLRREMKKLSEKNLFEEAAKARDRITAVNNLYSGKPLEHEIISLKQTLDLPALPLVIEAIDISSLGEKDAVGSLVSFKDGLPSKSDYRRFMIKGVSGINDYAMIAEVVRRRYSRLVREKKKMPDLLIIDGGRGHVLAAIKELEKIGALFPVVGISKKEEEIWFPEKKRPLKIEKGAPSLKLIQRIRDEAHRFANNYQRLRRKKRLLP
ncbi:MAG: hypothetical protein GF375_03395 [Candidatus Omnitrophica bacterium]|nr:hypothetical protein [Candidatus Omnitrophota bacterium]MBD3269119.1 hypothetical protein [Candidatus Omnitrophota bacterium]